MKLSLEPTEDLQVVTIEAECLIHVLQQSTRCSNQDIHSRKSFPLILEILSTDHEPCRKGVERSNGTQYFENLYSLGHMIIK
jgi:hypothetical protein